MSYIKVLLLGFVLQLQMLQDDIVDAASAC